MDRIESYRDLVVWRRSVDLAEAVYLATRSFLSEERFGLTSQSRRAAVSVAANIAEGYGRGSRAAYAGFLRIARGSLKELETHILIAMRLDMMPAATGDAILAASDEIGRMLNGLLARRNKPRSTAYCLLPTAYCPHTSRANPGSTSASSRFSGRM